MPGLRTGEGLVPRRFSCQNFYVPGVKLRYTSPRSLGELGVEGLVNHVFPGQPAGRAGRLALIFNELCRQV